MDRREESLESASDRQIKRGRGSVLDLAVLILALGLGWACITSHSLWIERVLIEPTRLHTAALSSPRGAPSEAGEPTYYLDFDGYYFVSYARQLVSSSRARIHWTWLDATPDGRSVHWSAPFSWWLVGLGSVHSALSGESLNRAIAAAAYYANPLLLGVLIAAAGAVLRRRFGAAIAGTLVVVLATHPRLLEDFAFAKPDHHGLHVSFALATLLCAIVGGGGWVADPGSPPTRSRRFPPPRVARRWMAASGVCGGVGLWIGSTQMSVVIAGMGLGGALAGWCFGNLRDERVRFRPEFWRSWALAGTATSLGAYAIEYLPGGAGMRLEVNHPLYALAWLCGGEIVARTAHWRSTGMACSSREWILRLGLLGGSLLLPLAIALGPIGWYLPRDPYMLNLHSRIDEFLPHFASGPSTLKSLAFLGLPALGALVGTISLFTRRWSAPEAGRALVVLTPCWVLIPCVLVQSRWLGLFVAAGTCALAVTLDLAASEARKDGKGRALSWALFALVGLGLALNLGSIWTRHIARPDTSVRAPLPLDVHLRDLALNLCPPADGQDPVRLMTGPGEAARIHFFGRCRGVGTPYWENVEGLHATADFFTAEDDDRARAILREHEIDYVLIARSASFIEYMLVTRNGIQDSGDVAKTLGHRLVSEARSPTWLEAVRIPEWPGNQAWRLFRVKGK